MMIRTNAAAAAAATAAEQCSEQQQQQQQDSDLVQIPFAATCKQQPQQRRQQQQRLRRRRQTSYSSSATVARHRCLHVAAATAAAAAAAMMYCCFGCCLLYMLSFSSSSSTTTTTTTAAVAEAFQPPQQPHRRPISSSTAHQHSSSSSSSSRTTSSSPFVMTAPRKNDDNNNNNKKKNKRQKKKNKNKKNLLSNNTKQIKAKPPPLPQQQQQPKNKNKNNNNNNNADDLFLYRSMMEHDILTKAQEMELGATIQKANQVRQSLDLLLFEKKQERIRMKQKQQQQQQQYFNKLRRVQKKDDATDRDGDDDEKEYDMTALLLGDDDNEDDNIDDDHNHDEKLLEDYKHLSIYGGGGGGFYNNNHQEQVQDEATAQLKWLARDQAVWQKQRESSSLMAYAWQQDAYGNMSDDDDDETENEAEEYDPEMDNNSSNNNNLSSSSAATTTSTTTTTTSYASLPLFQDLHFYLTDDSVNQALGITGGLAQVESILLNGARARDTLIRSNIRLVVGIAKKWARNNGNKYEGSSSDQISSSSSTGSGSSSSNMESSRKAGDHALHALYTGGWDRPAVNEAVQEGILGLAKAAERYEPSRGLRFSTYATHWVTNSIRQCFQRTSTGVLRLPKQFYEIKTRYQILCKEYYHDGKAEPSLEEIANEMNLTPQRLRTVLRMTRPLLSTDGPVSRGSRTQAGKAGGDGVNILISDTLVDTMEMQPEDRVELAFLRQCLENAMAAELAPHERDIIRFRLGLDDGVPRTCRQVAQECYGGSLTTNDVKYLERRAFKKLRSPQTLSTYKLLAYLDFCDVDQETMTLR